MIKDIYHKDHMLHPTCTITPLTSGFLTLQDTNIPGLTVSRSAKTKQVCREQLILARIRGRHRVDVLLFTSVITIYHLPTPLHDVFLPVIGFFGVRIKLMRRNKGAHNTTPANTASKFFFKFVWSGKDLFASQA